MSKINQLVFFVSVFVLVVFLLEFIEGRGILRRKHEKKQKRRLDDSVEIYFKRTSPENTDVACHGSGCKRTEEHHRRHHHGKPKNMKKKKHGKNKKKRRRNRQRKEKSKMAAVSLEDMFQSEDILADHHERASYDQYYAGFGRGFDRLQRPPEADRLERRLHPSVGSSAHHLVSSIDRVIMAIKSNIQQMHDTYDFAFNHTRYTMMMGVRDELQNIAKANDMVYDVVMDISLLTKDIYMRAHRRGDTRPKTYRKPEMPKFSSFGENLESVQNAERLTKVAFDRAQGWVDECQKQDSYVLQLEEILSENTNERELSDLVRHVNMTVWKLQAEFDTAMVARKLGRFSLTNGGTTRDDVIAASDLVRKAKEVLREAAATSRGNLIAAGDLRRQRGGGLNPLAPVSFTDRRPHGRSMSRPRRSTYITAAERHRLRPIINRAVNHAEELERLANKIARLMNPLIRQADKVVRGDRGGGASYRLQATLLADRLVAHVQQIHTVLDRIRLVVNDDGELRRRCEELEMGSGDDGDTTPIDCDEYLDPGSAEKPSSPDLDADDSDFIFDEDKSPKRVPDNSLKTFGDKLRTHVVQLGQQGDITLVKSQTARKKLRAISTRWNATKVNLQFTRRFVDEAKQFLNESRTERPNIDRISDRIKAVHERVDLVYNITQSKTFQAVLKAERKVNEVKGGDGTGGTTNGGSGGSGGSESQDYAAAVEAKGKAQATMRSMLTLTRQVPSMMAGLNVTIGKIQANISSLRSKVEKARMMLASMQMSINKQDEGYLPLPLAASDDSLTLRTSVEVCIRPEVADGQILLVSGNNSEYYSLSISSSSLKMTVYDKGGYETGDVGSTISLEKDKWYNVLIQRNGQKVALMVRPEGSNDTDVVEDTVDMAYGQPPPPAVYVGGAPDSLPMYLTSDVWKGCLGGLRVNGQSVGLLQKTIDGIWPTPCSSSCSPSLQPPSMVFEGNGYAHYPVHTAQLRYPTRSVYFEFRTRQEDAFLMTIVKRGFQLRARLQDGKLYIETTTPSEAVVLTEENNKYNDGLFHKLKIGYRDSRTYPEIDDKEGLFSIGRTRPDRIPTPTQGILIGGMLPEHREKMGDKFRPLIGCVRKLQINDVTMTMSEVEGAEGVYVGSCTSNKPLLTCVQFGDTSKPIEYGTTDDAAAVVIVATRASRGPLLQYQKGESFNAIISMEEKGIVITESVKSYDGRLEYEKDDNSMFVVIKITDKSSTLTVEYQGKEASISYGGGWGFLGGGSNEPYSVTIGGQDADNDMPPFSGGISQMIVGEQYLDMAEYVPLNGLSSCPAAHKSEPVSVDVRRR